MEQVTLKHLVANVDHYIGQKISFEYKGLPREGFIHSRNSLSIKENGNRIIIDVLSSHPGTNNSIGIVHYGLSPSNTISNIMCDEILELW